MFGVLVWLIAAGALVVIEAMTVELVCIWFALGCLFSALAAFVDAPFWTQLLICLLSSVAVLIVGRPILLEKLKVRRQATNADRVVGQVGIVKQQIDNLRQTGRVAANGLDWTARSELGEVIPEGAPVLVLRIDGVKLIVQTLPGQEDFSLRPADAEPLTRQSRPSDPGPSDPEAGPAELYTVPNLPEPPSLEIDADIRR